jgi:hypothetical protein
MGTGFEGMYIGRLDVVCLTQKANYNIQYIRNILKHEIVNKH